MALVSTRHSQEVLLAGTVRKEKRVGVGLCWFHHFSPGVMGARETEQERGGV